MEVVSSVSARRVVAAACAARVALSGVAQADQRSAQRDEARRAPRLKVLERPTEGLQRAIDAHLVRLAERAERAQRRAAARRSGGVGTPSSVGVAQGTLDAIAACESGGDPGAVNVAGYYGKYQFDLGTWQSVGGRGNPASAPEREQDYRAAVLYSRAGASPWPVCGA